MTYKITGYQPERLFHFFEEISAIPRGSSNEKGISDYLVEFAKARGLWCHQDELYNVVIKKPASAGAEDKPAVMLQGHLDMVCEKLAGVAHDFEKDGIDLIVQDGVVTANGTTLGGDNGAAVALMMTVLDDDSLTHPALECVFTTQEETGLTGASGLDKSLISARTMINLDSEEEGIATVSCAGGMRFTMTRPVTRRSVSGKLLRVSVAGLLGGHSGTDIDKERQNGIILLARLVNRVLHSTQAQLALFQGGSKDNAIPREVEAVLVCSPAEIEKAESIARSLAADFADELLPFEPDFTCAVSVSDGTAEVVSEANARASISAICLAPNGVRRRNIKQDGFVVTSLNLGVARLGDTDAVLVFAPRSSVASLQEDTKDRLYLLAETFGFDCAISGAYPGWSFAEHSPIRDTFVASYHDLFGTELKIEALHAGLECGLFSDALPGLDAIAVGPTIRGCHTPDEYLPLDSFARFYTLLTDVLARLAKR